MDLYGGFGGAHGGLRLYCNVFDIRLNGVNSSVSEAYGIKTEPQRQSVLLLFTTLLAGMPPESARCQGHKIDGIHTYTNVFRRVK